MTRFHCNRSYNILPPDLVSMSAHYKHRGIRTVTCHGTQPELQPCMLIPQPRVPHQHINAPLGQEELKNKMRTDNTPDDIQKSWVKAKNIPPKQLTLSYDLYSISCGIPGKHFYLKQFEMSYFMK